MSKFKKYNMIALIVSAFVIFNAHGVFASGSDTKDIGNKSVTDINKVWIVTFKSAVDISSLSNNLEIKDLTSNNTFSPTVASDDNGNSIKIVPPSGGYTTGHKYQLILKDGIKSKKGKSLPKTTVLTFSILPKSDNYNVKANVTVSPVIDIFKIITVTSTNLPGAQKYKIEGNKNLVNIGKPITSIVAGESVKVYICDSLGNVLATTNMDVISTKNNMDLNLTL